MQLTLPREEFIDAVNWTANILPAKPYTPIFGGVHISNKSGVARFAAYDTEISASIMLGINGQPTDGDVLVSGRLLAAISRVLPKQQVNLFTGSGGESLYLSCGTAEFRLPTMSADEYPQLPTLPETTGIIDGGELAEAVARVMPAASQDQALPHLCAVAVEITNGDKLTLFATDKNRVASCEVGWSAKSANPVAWNTRLLVPTRALLEMTRLTGTDVRLGFDDAKSGILGMTVGTRKVTTRLLDGQYPNPRSIWPKQHIGLATVDTNELAGALQRVLLMYGNEPFPQVDLDFKDDGLYVRGGSEMGAVSEMLPYEFTGDTMQITINPRYVMDAIGGCRSDKVLIGLQGPLKPVTIVPYTEPPKPLEAAGWEGLRGAYMHIMAPISKTPK